MLCVIFDVDGTLADVSGVRHYVSDPKNKNFEKFHGAASFSPANQWVVDAAKGFHDAGTKVFVVTGRKERWRFRTSMWLRKWEIPFDALLMRADADQRKDVEVKRDILGKIRAEGYEVLRAYDDNPNIIALWESEQIAVVVVPGWEHENG